MIGNIVIFSDHFVHSLVDIVEESSLTVGLFCVSDYSDCVELVQTLPNLIGVLIVDWKPTKRTMKFYQELLDVCDHISLCREVPLTVSILHRVAKSARYIQKYKTRNIYLYTLKLSHVTDTILKLDGLGPILSESQGLFHQKPSYAINPSKTEFDSDYFNTVIFALMDDEYEISYEMLDRHPLLRSIQNKRNGDLSDVDLRKLLEHTPFIHMYS